MDDGDPQSLVTFERDGTTVHVRDTLERATLPIEIEGDPTLQPALEDVFLFPVDEAVTVSASRLRFTQAYGGAVWDDNGDPLQGFSGERHEHPRGTYYASVRGTVKIHLRITDTAIVATQRYGDPEEIAFELQFDEQTTVAIGARSLHTRPEATITVGDDPTDLLTALPYLGSSIKEFSCERSWPTLRGHPPAIEHGDGLEVPSPLETPETGVTVRIPATFEHAYQVAPLVFYLGADVRAGERPALELANGHVEPLESRTESLADRVAALLARCLLLDSLVRESGYIPVERAEYDQLAAELPFYPANLYDVSIPDQLLEYLEVGHETLSPFYPQWPKTAVVRPDPADVDLLSPLVDELARIRVDPAPQLAAGSDRRTVEPRPVTSSLLAAHSRGRAQPGTCRLVPAAFDHAREYERPTPADAEITVATMDPDRARALRRFETPEDGTLSVIERPTTDAIERLLASDRTMASLELPGAGVSVECADGSVALDRLTDVDVATVALVGEERERAGRELVRAGAIAGLTTDRRLRIETARNLCSLVARGFSLADAARLAGIDRETDVRYVGDASATAVHLPGQAPVVAAVEPVGHDEYEFALSTRPTDISQLGSVSRYDADDQDVARRLAERARHGFWLTGASAEQPRRLSTDDVVSLCVDERLVVTLNDRLLTVDDDVESILRNAARSVVTDADHG